MFKNSTPEAKAQYRAGIKLLTPNPLGTTYALDASDPLGTTYALDAPLRPTLTVEESNLLQAKLEAELAQLQQILDGDPVTLGTLGQVPHFQVMSKMFQTHAQLYALQKQPDMQYSDCSPETVAEALVHAKAKLQNYRARILEEYKAAAYPDVGEEDEEEEDEVEEDEPP
jgi:hypothetical protein